jgi:hypothetical protein
VVLTCQSGASHVTVINNSQIRGELLTTCETHTETGVPPLILEGRVFNFVHFRGGQVVAFLDYVVSPVGSSSPLDVNNI